ncbi:hypothetical protein SAMN02799630_03763 [Paenibacillus sp. UNCCL117]|uniref:CBO0543 family protein n=1 Tax=unclassified Paenibacillus TaxID=185978 RepID=UPI00088394F9|nr:MULTISPECIES: CBO0543 family protein [unclassified Paenibacillus]SDD48810.1 hypothetical protein SAMN04488602_10933 [Paenibacillus sp. cl123]SFW50158.1 hypothetical protein SAMN02799630_03763 [Paenibacillus sp. UNCCL117]
MNLAYWTLERWLLIAVYVISAAALLKIHRTQPRKVQAVFLFQQCSSWILGLLVVEAGLLDYPIREFRVATRTSFAFEFLVFPVIACYVNMYYPRQARPLLKFGYFAAYASGGTILEYLIEKYTELITYTGWAWYWTFLSVMLSLGASRLFLVWFMDQGKSRVH